MDSHSIAEMTAGLASRVHKLAVLAAGQDSKTLMGQQDDLAKLAMAAIVQDLDSSQQVYVDAVKSLQDATDQANVALNNIQKVSQVIIAVADAITKSGKALA